MRGDEELVVDAFTRWLVDAGWSVRVKVDHCDVVADRGPERLYAEAKGETTSRGLDVDTLYGQLLRRMVPGADHLTRYGVVVRPSCRQHALRVPEQIRSGLRIDVYQVSDAGAVELIRPAPGLHQERS